ncbi:MAG: ribosome maturation factor RimM [Actinomycetes bacterium]
MDLVVGRLGRPHGVHGEISVEVRTDEPEIRFAKGSKLSVKENNNQLTVLSSRWHQEKMLVKFEEITDRDLANEIKGKTLTIKIDPNSIETKKDQYYEFQLAGLKVIDKNDKTLGQIKEVITNLAQDLLVVETVDKREVLVPFVKQIVTNVDLNKKLVIMDPPTGLFDEENAIDAN